MKRLEPKRDYRIQVDGWSHDVDGEGSYSTSKTLFLFRRLDFSRRLVSGHPKLVKVLEGMLRHRWIPALWSLANGTPGIGENALGVVPWR